jgi:hypothetical protein
MPPPGPPVYPLVYPSNRERITQEPPAGKNAGDRTRPLDTDWSSRVKRGGGAVRRPLFWGTNPKQDHDDTSAG